MVKTGRFIVGPDHLLRIETGEEPTNIDDGFLDVQLSVIKVVVEDLPDIINFFTIGRVPEECIVQQKKELVARVVDFTIIFGQFYKLGVDEVLKRYVLEN